MPSPAATGEALVEALGELVESDVPPQDLIRRLPATAEPMSKKSRLLKGRVIGIALLRISSRKEMSKEHS
jgi:hypothetical protein